MTRTTVLVVAILAMQGCAEKKPHHSHLPLAQGVHIEFRGIKDGKCEIADVLVDAKGGYTVICK